ncbi:hypothetical protein CICLE_v10033462mg, partial [Citrus x clementina]
MSRKNRMRAESGTCNVCFAPCSSCMHLNLALMGSKTEEFSDETCRETTGSQYSINEADDLRSFKRGPCNKLQQTASEASNPLSVNSSHDSFSVNAESKVTLRSSEISDASEDFEIHPKFSSRGGPEGLEKAQSSEKLELSEIPSVEKVGASCGSPKVRSPVPDSQSDKRLVESSSDVLTKVHQKSEAETDGDNGEPPDEALKCLDKDKEELKSTQLAELPDVQRFPAASGDETDESDIMEQDVKVCDICGDAGREDLLAICSRCSDGAEHTYCMKEMLQKVPEGDWLCEECKFAEETEKQKQGSDIEGKRTNKQSTSTQSSGKRHAENLDAAPAAKRQAIETSPGYPKPLSPSKAAALSRDSSFKSLDKGKVRPVTFGNNSSNDVVETARSPGGTLLKSSSFSTLNSKAKVKLVDEVVPQKQKATRDQASLDVKEGPSRVMGKSMSFKSTSSGRSSAGESKLRALSPRPSRLHDLKGLKQVKERNAFERKSLSRLDRSLTVSSMATPASTPKADQKLTPRGEAVSFSSASNNREAKVVKSEGKGSTLTKSNSTLPRKGLEVSGTPGMALLNKVKHINASTIVNELVQDGLPRSVESTNQGEKSSSCRSRPTLTAGSKGVLCQKCKEVGHDVESCPLGSTQVSGIDVSAGRNCREGMIKGNKLKAAIEAAMHKLPGTYGRNKVNDQLDGLGITNMDLNCERSSQDQFSVSNKMKGAQEVPINKQTTINQLKPALLKISAVPEHENIWHFSWWLCPVHRGEKLPNLCDGIQAHLSSCASSKVLEVVSKFPQRICLKEVPRVSTWPTMFHESGAKEENIALYFFAKDFESYGRNYKILVDSMMKNDLALMGNLDGIELLIFPSNQLPENCQRWNLLFFLWGVFRVRKVNCSNSTKHSCFAGSKMVPLDSLITTDNLSLSQNILPKHADKDSAACDTSHNIVPGSYGPDGTCVTLNENCDNKASSVQQTSLGSQSNSIQHD